MEISKNLLIMKKLSENDLQNIFSLKEEDINNEKEDDNIFLELMKNVRPLKNNKKISSFEYKQLKNLIFNKDIQNNNNNCFKINQISKKDLKNIKNNKKHIDAILDLHGETSKNAEILLNNFVQRSYLQGKRLLIIITGKGNNSLEKQDGLGILKSMFLNWVNSEYASKYIVSFSNANSIHGGEGAYYLVLRKNSNL